jgi:hypothetical protein
LIGVAFTYNYNFAVYWGYRSITFLFRPSLRLQAQLTSTFYVRVLLTLNSNFLAGWRKLLTERPFNVGQAARVAAPARHLGVAGRHTAVHGAACRRNRAAPRHLRRRGRHADALSPALQQQPNHKLVPIRGRSPPLPLSPTHTTRLRGATKNLRGAAPYKESQTSKMTPPHTSAFHSRTRPRPAHP